MGDRIDGLVYRPILTTGTRSVAVIATTGQARETNQLFAGHAPGDLLPPIHSVTRD